MRVLLFAGKGGVGKTTLAAGTAGALAVSGRKTLVVSTDPAHSLADALDVAVGADPTEVDAGLSACQVDIRALVDGAWEQLRGHLGTVLAGAGVDDVLAEELTVLPGLEELLALAEVARMARRGIWDVVVVDCAPTADSLRLLALPEAVSTYLERLFPTHRRLVRGLLAGLAGDGSSAQRWDEAADAIGRLAERLESLRALLTDPQVTGVRLVLTPERVVAAETRRTVTALTLQGIRVDGLIANRLVPAPAVSARGTAAGWLRTRRREQDAVLAALCSDLPDLPVTTVEHHAAEPVGLPALLGLAGSLGEGAAMLGDARPGVPLLAVEHVGGSGLDSEYVLRLAVSLLDETDPELARVGDEIAVTSAGHRRLITLPSVLRRCVVTGAEVDGAGLLVRFRPDPALWMR
ncbi:MAG: AAA family ATPase [Pseudonocardiaceae bacterium]|nr:AAA family ATPase [Pseudonocardiaceae bacterium]